MKDWCTNFPEYWPRWVHIYKWKVIYIGEICKDHDISDEVKECSTSAFAKGLWANKVVGSLLIFLLGTLVCWIKYPVGMWKRI